MKQKPILRTKILKIFGIVFLVFTLFVVVLLLPITQTFLGHRVSDRLFERFGVELNVDNIHISPFGYATFEDVLAIDHKKDTLLYVGYARTSALKLRAVLKGDNNLGEVFIRDVSCNVVTYLGDDVSNMDLFFDRLKTQKTKNENTGFYISSIQLTKADLRILNKNKQKNSPIYFSNINADIENFSFIDNTVQGLINQLDTKTSWKNTQITSISGNYLFSSNQMKLTSASFQTSKSTVETDIILEYPKKGLKHFTELVHMDVKFKNANLNASDLKNIFPNWNLGNIGLSANLKGTLNDFSVRDGLVFKDDNKLDFSLKANKFLDDKTRTFSLNWNFLSKEIDKLFGDKISVVKIETLPFLGAVSSIGKAKFSNNVWNVNTSVDSELGQLNLDVLYRTNSKFPSYNVNLNSTWFDIGSLLSVPTLKTAGFDISLKGKGFDFDKINVTTSGELINLSYRNYIYDKVKLEGDLSPDLFRGNLSVSDTSLNLGLEGEIDFAAETRNFSITSNITHADFAALGWIPQTMVGVFSGSVDLALQGNTIDEMIGDLYIEQGKLNTPQKTFFFSSVAVQSRLSDNIRVINVNSQDIATGLLIGEFKPSELPNLVQNALGSQYSNYIPKNVTPNQYVDFNFNVRGKIAAALFGDGIILDNNTFIKGKINPRQKYFQLSIRAPKLQTQSTELDKLEVQIDTSNPLYHSFISVKKIANPQGVLHDLNWINSKIKDTLYGRGEFTSSKTPDKLNQLNTSFTINDKGEGVLGIHSADFYLNKRRWNLDVVDAIPKLTLRNRTQLSLSNLTLKSDDSKISLTAAQKNKNSFSIGLSLEEVALSDMLTFEKDNWEGVVNGFLNINQTANGFGGNSSLEFSNMKLNNIPLGNAFVTLQSKAKDQTYDLALRVQENDVDVISATGNIGIDNNTPTWDINATFLDYNLSAIAGLTNTVFTPFDGKANGNLNFNSNNGVIIAKGTLNVDSLRLGVPYLNTLYSFNSTVPFDFQNDGILINEAVFEDNTNHKAALSGILNHRSFSNWDLDMNVNANNLTVLDTDFSESALYYGKAFFTGDAHIHGPFSNMKIDVIGQTASGTSLFIPIQYDTAIGDVSFINFVEKDEQQTQSMNSFEAVKGLQMNFDLDITPDAEVEIVVDPETKSFLRGVGAGNLLLEIDTAGSFAIWGDFIAFEGVYNFKNLGLIDKTFRLQPGGTIVWEGDPYGAQINMQAIYDVPGGANPAVLLEGDNVSQKIPTEVTINLFGNLLNPETPTFEIDFPNSSGVIKNELNYKLNDQERTQLQAISLLSQGSFINQVSLAAISSQTLTNNLFQKASGLFDNIFTSEYDKLNLSLDYLQGDRNAAASIQNRDRLGVSLSTNINDRIIIDGKVGVPVGSEEETTIIGDVSVEFLLNKQGTLRARVFNKENEFQYFGDELGYTQGIGVNYQVRFDNVNTLVEKLFNKKK